jgi:hypothetical protein
MKKYLYILFIGLMMSLSLSLSSCEVYSHATTMDDIYYEAQADMVRSDVDFNIVIRYGTPYYYEGTLLYYLYNGLYYYPFYYDDYWYVRVYRRPFDYLGYRPYFRPHRYDYRFEPGHHRGFDRPPVRPHGNRFGQGSHQPRPHHDARPGNGNRPQPGVRPGNNGNHNPRPDVRPTRPSNRNGFGNGSRPSTPSRSITPRPSTPSRSITPRSSSPAPRISSPSSGGGSRSGGSSGGRFGGRR